MTYPVCPHCRQKVINPGGHAERCHGPIPERERECDCPPGWRHRRSCPAAYWPEHMREEVPEA